MCSAEALSTLGVPDLTIASTVAMPTSCVVTGTVKTAGNAAGFQFSLPANWNGKLVFFGVGGTGGSLDAPAGHSASTALGRGYATALTDTGHTSGNADVSFALTSVGMSNEAALTDYQHRAAHTVAVAAKAFVSAFYGGTPVRRAYFDGCSNGGRMALMEAMKYPEDFDGIIAGAPFMTFRQFLTLFHGAKSQLPAASRIPAAMLPVIQRAYVASCDGIDGVIDGLIQNPAQCSFEPETLLCKGEQDANCLTRSQVLGFLRYLRPLTDAQGEVLVPGYPPSTGNFETHATGPQDPVDTAAAEPWDDRLPPRGWLLANTTLKYIVMRDPRYDARRFRLDGENRIHPEDLAIYDERTRAGNADDPAALDRFVAQGRKLILYHGTDDHSLSYYQTTRFWDLLDARHAAKSSHARPVSDTVRLFIVPGMNHCGAGPGPNVFDLLDPLDRWVEQAVPPNAIPATHHADNKRDAQAERTMPLCAYPGTARYRGAGDLNSAANWECPPNQNMRIRGPDGQRAGLNPRH